VLCLFAFGKGKFQWRLGLDPLEFKGFITQAAIFFTAEAARQIFYIVCDGG
jgi:hypothetical protein